MGTNAFHSSRWGVPGALAGLFFAAAVPGCFGLSESDYLHDAGPSVVATGSGGGTSNASGGSGGSATAGSLGSGGSVGTGGVVGSGGSVGNAGSPGNGGSVANGGGGMGGNGGAAQGGAGGQGGAATVCPANPMNGTGTGLKGEYYSTMDLSGTVTLTRTDPNVDFDWGTGSPGGTVPVDKFSVRWSGQVQPRYTGTYTFSTTSDDGSRVFVNNLTTAIVDAFVDQSGNMENTGTVDLVAGQKYPIKVEYYDNAVNALVHLSWSSDCQTKEIVPMTQLYPQ